MKKVIDSNFLQSEALRAYLLKSPTHHVVLTDYAFMEAYKADTLFILYRSMEILSQYPKQVIVLKGTLIVGGLSGRSAQLQKRLIDVRGTRGFPDYCKELLAAQRGNQELQAHLLYKAHAARDQMDRIAVNAEEFRPVLEAITDLFTDEEQKILRTGSPYTAKMGEKMISHICLMAAFLLKKHPTGVKMPNAREVRNTFIFRLALCMHLLAHRWISVGGVGSTKVAKIRNDFVDVSFAAYATYFDGILTDDKKLKEIYAKAVFLLDNVCRPTAGQ